MVTNAYQTEATTKAMPANPPTEIPGIKNNSSNRNPMPSNMNSTIKKISDIISLVVVLI